MTTMTVSSSTRTHVVYQFIILTLLFLSVGYNDLLPDRKFVLFLAFAPIFCYQLVIVSCCMELFPVPSWMGFLQQEDSNNKASAASNDFQCSRSSSSESVRTSSPIRSEGNMSFPDATEIPSPWRRQKSVTNLAARRFNQSQKSKSWMSLNESKSAERLLSSREGSLDVLVPLANRKCTSSIIKQSERTRSREERSQKARSWKPVETNFHTSNKAELAKSVSLSTKSSEQPSSICTAESEESEISKSFSFPFRQKRLGTWLERNETAEGSNQSLDMPYWHSVGYNLAVKYEARRRQRASDNLEKSDHHNEESSVQKHQEPSPDAGPSDRHHHSKKSSKLAAARINKLKVGISNLISKKKDEVSESSGVNPNKVSRSSILLRLRNKKMSSCPDSREKPSMNLPDFTRFSNDDRPQIFYPRYLPFEKERFESDVKNKIKELSEEQKTQHFPVLI